MSNTYVNKVELADGTTLIDISDSTVTSGSMLNGVKAYAASGAAVTGNIASKSSSDLTASTLTVTAPSGYYASNATKTLSDQNLIAENIKKDIQIFGVTGSYEGGGGGTTWETVYSGSMSLWDEWSDGHYFAQINNSLLSEEIPYGSVWRISWDGDTYECTATEFVDTGGNAYCIGNCTYDGGQSGTEFPFFFQTYSTNNVWWVGSAVSGSHTIKIEKQVSGGGGSTLITKTITANGTYSAEDDDADGYSSVTVNVPTPISNTVTGTFNFDSSKKGTAQEITLNYSGAGYPIAVMIYPAEGGSNSSGTFYSKVQRYAVAKYFMAKSFLTGSNATPTYTNSGNNNKSDGFVSYKSSSSNATSYSTSTTSTTIYSGDDATSSVASQAVRFKTAKKMSIFVADTSYGFCDGIEYTYCIQYSS